MFIGHYALALAGRKIDRRPSLAVLFFAVQLLDHAWPLFVLAGLEKFAIDPGNTKLTPLDFSFYPYSHSLLMALVWAALLAVIYTLITKNKQTAVLLAVLVFSHWVLDFLTHRPDLPLSPFSSQRVGLGLWNVPALEVLLEVGLFSLGVYWYVLTAKPTRKLAFWSMITFLVLVYFANIFGPPPPSISAVAWSANALWLVVFWAWWIERPKVSA